MLLEGLEVVFIVLTFGDNEENVAWPRWARSRPVVVAAVGLAVRAPLSRVPENTMKFGVGIMLTLFGMFWGAEGAGVHWPGNDAALLVSSRLSRSSASAIPPCCAGPGPPPRSRRPPSRLPTRRPPR